MLHGFVLFYAGTILARFGIGVQLALGWCLIAAVSLMSYRWFESPSWRLIRSLAA